VACRLTQPFVTWSLLVAEFSELAAEVASKYFTELPSGRYAFRPSYNRSASSDAVRNCYPHVLGRFAGPSRSPCVDDLSTALMQVIACDLRISGGDSTQAGNPSSSSPTAPCIVCLKVFALSCSEAAIKAIAPRSESPQWLVEEISRTRAGLMRLRQNVVLLPNADDSESFYPVRADNKYLPKAKTLSYK